MKFFVPDFYIKDLRRVAWGGFIDMGIRHVFLDIDNTLEPQGAQEAGENSKVICSAILAAGLAFTILSNAHTKRAQRFCSALDLPYLGHAAKPLTCRIRSYMQAKKLRVEEVLLVGDQIITDLWCARFLGARMLLVESLGGIEHGFLRVKRIMERFLRKLGQDPSKAPPPPLLS